MTLGPPPDLVVYKSSPAGMRSTLSLVSNLRRLQQQPAPASGVSVSVSLPPLPPIPALGDLLSPLSSSSGGIKINASSNGSVPSKVSVQSSAAKASALSSGTTVPAGQVSGHELSLKGRQDHVLAMSMSMMTSFQHLVDCVAWLSVALSSCCLLLLSVF